jgi:ribonuclease PH
MIREDGRKPGEIRQVKFTPDYVIYPEGSVLVSMGFTKVLCNVTIETRLPRWLQESGKPGGWITGEYSLLPRSTHDRTSRETRGLTGRTQEIRRMIGRSLRAGFNLDKLVQFTFIVDCDVLQADGGTRTAAITGGYVALRIALKTLVDSGNLSPEVFDHPIAAVSVGMVNGIPMLDLCYEEDAAAEVDVNVVMNGVGEFVEVQGTAEGKPFNKASFHQMLDLAESGINRLLAAQKDIYK